jgi:hypothetical protein
MFSPGRHLPVVPYENFPACYPDAALLFAWNHKNEISEEAVFQKQGQCHSWITDVPEATVSSVKSYEVTGGPGTAPSSPDRGIFNQAILKAPAGEPLTVYGTGEYLRDFLYI